MNHAVVHYHEIALKGKNRPLFVRKLVENIRGALKDLPLRWVEGVGGGVLLTFGNPVSSEAVAERLRWVFGIANFSLGSLGSRDLDSLKQEIARALDGRELQSFRVRTRRSDKSFPQNSMEVDRELGKCLVDRFHWPVQLEDPELTVHVEIAPKKTFFSFEKIAGPGGLPVGISGRVMTLISGGIDSPVAAYRMMQRGCMVDFVHFHSYPFLSKASIEKVEELIPLFQRHQKTISLFLVPFGEIQQEVVAKAPEPLRVILYRRLMARIAERLAKKQKALALVTGESLGQVASQTLENLRAIEQSVEIPIFRPLIGMDKIEIENSARKIGTYEISIQEDQDCCQLFIPKNPTTKAHWRSLEQAEKSLDIEGLTQQGIDRTILKKFSC
ncbi:MAG: tRNA 4-thiouridine(8) synthase ThiI [Deltaproteobacteria bacterium]|nr:tRNA 4-thiouridine(8) synthase ThiI [Deltaproteobacteria bacterium]